MGRSSVRSSVHPTLWKTMDQDISKRLLEEVNRLLQGLERDECAVCGRRRFFIDLLVYATRRYDLSSDGHTDFELFYCRDNPSCAEAVTELPDSLLDSDP